MNEDYRNDILTMREYLFNAVKASDQLLAVSEGAPMSSVSMQQTLERASAQFEDAVLEIFGQRLKVTAGAASTTYAEFIAGVHSMPVWMHRKGKKPVPGGLTFG